MAFRLHQIVTRHSDGRVTTEGPGKPTQDHATRSTLGPIRPVRAIGSRLHRSQRGPDAGAVGPGNPDRIE